MGALDQLFEEYLRLDREKEELEQKVTEKNKEMAFVKGRITAYMTELGRDDYQSPVAQAKTVTKERVNLPENDLLKGELFGYLRERGLFEKYATVNSNSLNAYYFKEREEAIRRGEDPMTFSIPGVGAPKSFTDVQIKPRKK